MTYEEVVMQVRHAFENADAREIYEHVAVQINIEGEGSGAFYMEVADRHICVEPYDYYDRDGLLTASADTLLAIAGDELSLEDAVKNGSLRVEGNTQKLNLLLKIKKSPLKGKAGKPPKRDEK